MDASSNHTCALSTSGEVKCWGPNGAGKLGIPYPEYSDTWGLSPSQIPNVVF